MPCWQAWAPGCADVNANAACGQQQQHQAALKQVSKLFRLYIAEWY
jgi:hypothetical protein